MEEKQLTERESLHLIRQMITLAKKEQKDDGWGWILWGWLLFCASVLTIANIRFHWFGTFYFWNLFGIVTFLILGYELVSKLVFKKGYGRVKTYTGDLFTRLNAGFFVCLMFIIVAINVGSRAIYSKYGPGDLTFVNIGFALLINLYAFWILIYGTALNFKPSIIGAYVAWGFGMIALFTNNFEQVMWLQAFAVLAGYIIPGHLANKEFKKIKREETQLHVLKELDPILHSQLRLAVMSLLISVKEAEFTYLKEKTGATAGNLSVQIQKLKDAGYIEVQKQFKDNYPQTICKVTSTGVDAFEAYVKALQSYIGQ